MSVVCVKAAMSCVGRSERAKRCCCRGGDSSMTNMAQQQVRLFGFTEGFPIFMQVISYTSLKSLVEYCDLHLLVVSSSGSCLYSDTRALPAARA